ncbi:hypothetical protein DAEQUDRAFT_761930 [Daedalea quercina L-15889]|uniref:Uncharacterized protein n=1 Tax=Daedalea quercina L-15889 TaxID=1314783 RepID=A0A165THS7_9APHY|nr:hypothetical protein DAEQUDRAFT_761930 [Daedalea quercina L-15889]
MRPASPAQPRPPPAARCPAVVERRIIDDDLRVLPGGPSNAQSPHPFALSQPTIQTWISHQPPGASHLATPDLSDLTPFINVSPSPAPPGLAALIGQRMAWSVLSPIRSSSAVRGRSYVLSALCYAPDPRMKPPTPTNRLGRT